MLEPRILNSHAWNEPGYKVEKNYKGPKIFLANYLSAAMVEPWKKNRDILNADGETRVLDNLYLSKATSVPQIQLMWLTNCDRVTCLHLIVLNSHTP